jgi:glycerophosphoryl diester phosphodiesterase
MSPKRLLRAAVHILVLLLLFPVIAGTMETHSGPLIVPDFALPPEENFVVVAHRGASRYAPENTLAAFRKAIELGANGIECDVIFTRDNVPVIAHDTDLSDVGPPLDLSRLTLEEARKLDVGSWFSPDFKGETMPTLAEALHYLRGKVDRVYLHDKRDNNYTGSHSDRIVTFAATIAEAGMKKSVVVMVEGENLSQWREYAPDIALLKCWTAPGAAPNALAPDSSLALGLRHLGVYHRPADYRLPGLILHMLGCHRWAARVGLWMNQNDVNSLRAKGCELVCFTLNDEFSMRLYIDAGFRAIGTDDPALLVSLLNSRKRANIAKDPEI